MQNEEIRIQKSTGDILSNVKYICKSSSLITEALQKGLDIAQLPNGDIIVTEIKAINTQYSWDPEKSKMVKVNSSYTDVGNR